MKYKSLTKTKHPINKSIKTNLLLLIITILYSCQEKDTTPSAQYNYIQPNYTTEHLYSTKDTAIFILEEDMYNSIKSMNLFSEDTIEYISFYDDRSHTINIYNLSTRHLTKRIPLKIIFKTKALYKTTVYCKSFDSIFVTNKDKLYMADSAGKIRLSIPFIENTRLAYATFENGCPATIRGDSLYTGVRPYVNDKSLHDLKRWKNIYCFDLKRRKATLHYKLPTAYQTNLYGYQFLDYSYCHNSEGHFVFSFPADTTIYKTDLSNYHNSFYAKSIMQDGNINPLSLDQIKNKDTCQKNYLSQTSYGAIHYDPFNKRYLRVARLKITEDDYKNKKTKREYHFVIFDENFRIIGESKIPENMSNTNLFFTKEGLVYARINAQAEDALRFIRLSYRDEQEYDKKSLTTK